MKRAALPIAIAFAALFTATTARAQPFGGGDVEEPPPPAPPAPPAPTATTDTPPPPIPPAPKKNVPIVLGIDGGYALRQIEKISVTGADVGVGLGAQPLRNLAFGGSMRLLIGGTENGLSTKAFRMNFGLNVIIDRFRLLIEPGLFMVGVSRATRDQTIVGWGPNLGLAARFDVIQADGFAIFARAGVEGGPVLADTSFFGGATFGAGIDFDLKKGDRGSL